MSLIHFSCKCNYSILLHNKTPIYSTWGLLRVCAACPTPRLNQSYELRPPWEQHLRYVPHRVRNGYNIRAWNSNEKYSYLWQTEHRKIFVLIQRRYPLYLQASCSDERLLSRAVICDGMDFSERRNFVREFVSVGNENHFLCPEVDSGVETIHEGKDIYL